MSDNRLSKIPEAIRDVFEALAHEAQWLHAEWKVFKQLYCRDQTRADLLTASCSMFFVILQGTMHDHVLLYLSRLTDEASQKRKSKLSLPKLQQRLNRHAPSGLAQQTSDLLDELRLTVEPIRDIRNRQLVHSDLNTMLGLTEEPQSVASIATIDEAMRCICAILNAVESYYCNSHTGYEYVSLTTDGDALVDLLKRGLRYDTLQQENKIHWDDLKLGEWYDA